MMPRDTSQHAGKSLVYYRQVNVQLDLLVVLLYE